ncbi:uncharacterized protein LOC126971126 [Leptidea sinapis]|uniref:uncharacterized protein LOC126971126 n=1 Tax=Leptidea sinapis TaxID=189913 RepID=UPI0021C4742E|nr:uncharacterized protein LOC126971126 [Leptidea sinapis]
MKISQQTKDPYVTFIFEMNSILFGRESVKVYDERLRSNFSAIEDDFQIHAPNGKLFRSELFLNRSGVHLPLPEYMHPGYCQLEITDDYMQTAVNALAIFLNGDLDDIARIPGDYILRSARTISMLILPREKLAMTWFIVKGKTHAIDVTYETLARFHPLFKYVGGKEIARLNLSDPRILNYIGTHPDLDRHQFFYHIRACDPLQRRFYLALMTQTQVLGKSYSWTAREVARLGLLLTEVRGPDLAAINPSAMVGLSSHIMYQMSPRKLRYFTEKQTKYIRPKALNILAKKLEEYQIQQLLYGQSSQNIPLRIYFYCLIYQSVFKPY